MFQIIIKVSPLKNQKINVTEQTTPQNIQDMLDENECNYFHRNKLLDAKKTLIEQNVQSDDILIQMKKPKKQSKSQLNEEPIIFDNAEDYKQQVLELIDKGYKREDIVQSMIAYRYNLQQVMQNLIYGRRRLMDEDNLEQMKDQLMKLDELKSIVQCIKHEDWIERFYQIQQKDRKAFNELMQNSQALVELLSELVN